MWCEVKVELWISMCSGGRAWVGSKRNLRRFGANARNHVDMAKCLRGSKCAKCAKPQSICPRTPSFGNSSHDFTGASDADAPASLQSRPSSGDSNLDDDDFDNWDPTEDCRDPTH